MTIYSRGKYGKREGAKQLAELRRRGLRRGQLKKKQVRRHRMGEKGKRTVGRRKWVWCQ